MTNLQALQILKGVFRNLAAIAIAVDLLYEV